MPGQVLADAEHHGLDVHVTPAKPQRLADMKPSVGEELEQSAVGVRHCISASKLGSIPYGNGRDRADRQSRRKQLEQH
jgi:hypothetical protein